MGWSGATGEQIGQEIVDYLNNLRGWVKAKPWTQFDKGVSVWEQLLESLSKMDAAILIATPQDPAQQRGALRTLPRDNIILEYGLFTGALSRERVLLLKVGDPDLPTDMLGVNQATLSLPTTAGQLDAQFAESVRSEICEFIKRTRCAQRAEVEIRRAVYRMPKAHRLLPDVFWSQCNPENYPTYTDEDLERAVQACTIWQEMDVGLESKPARVHAYVDFSRADSYQECLATRLADAVIEWLKETDTRPSKIALLGRPDLPEREEVERLDPRQRVATRGLPLLEQAAGHLGYPVLFVDAEDGQVDVFGQVDSEDNIVIIHDVVLSGQKPVRAACGLRDRGAKAQHLFSLVVNPPTSVDDLVRFLDGNRLCLRYKTIANSEGASP